MENINLIPANDLPLAGGEQVEVLCLENGEMKRKPADGLGGSSYDAVILFTRDPDNERDTLELESGSYAKIHAKIMAGEIVSVAMKTVELSGGVPFIRSVSTAVLVTCSSDKSAPVNCYLHVGNDLWMLLIESNNNVYWD